MDGSFHFELYRCRKATQEGGSWFFGNAGKGECLRFLPDMQYMRCIGFVVCIFQRQWYRVSRAGQQSHAQGDMQSVLVLLARSIRYRLFNAQGVFLPVGIMAFCHGQFRCAGSGVPSPELFQIMATGVFHGTNEIVCGHCLAVMS